MTRVVCIGEAMIEIAPDGPATAALSVAGDTFNTAVYLKRCAPQLDVAYATKLGRDPFSDRIMAAATQARLDTALVVRSDGTPGLYAITTDASGERTFTYWRDGSAARQMLRAPMLDLDALAQADVVYLSAITLAILPPRDRDTLLDAVRETTLVFDSNYRPTLWESRTTAQQVVERATRQASILLPSLDDEMALYGDTDEDAVLARLGRWGADDGVLKRGAAGPRALNGTDAGSFAAASRVVDTTAAGDAFNAGYLAARLTGQDTATAMQAGHALATCVIGHRGAILPETAMPEILLC